MVKLVKVDQYYDVVAPDGMTTLGYVYKASDQAWSYAPWVIGGVHAMVKGGVTALKNDAADGGLAMLRYAKSASINSAVLAKQIAA